MNRIYASRTHQATTSWEVRSSILTITPHSEGMSKVVYTAASDAVVYEPLRYLLFITPPRQIVQATTARGSVVYGELRKKHIRRIQSPLQDDERA